MCLCVCTVFQLHAFQVIVSSELRRKVLGRTGVETGKCEIDLDLKKEVSF